MSRKKIAPERKKEIIDGLYTCLANAGHEQVTIKDIAKAANLSYGVIHYYFDSKKDIMLALVDDFIRGHETLFQDRLRHVDEPWERLRLFISFAVDHAVVDPEASMFFLNLYQMAMNDEDIRAGARFSYSRLRNGIREVVDYGVSCGEFAEVDVEEFSFYFAGCIEGMWLQVAMDPGLFKTETIKGIIYEKAKSELTQTD